MKQTVFFVMLLISQVIFATNNQTRTERLVTNIQSDVPTLTAEQNAQICVATAVYMAALQNANQQYAQDLKTRIETKAAAQQVYHQQLQTIMTAEQWQQLNAARTTRQNQLAEQYKH